ncbi:MAG: hypothetical protein C0616_13820, partial [Desulfuromonas sp.]
GALRSFAGEVAVVKTDLHDSESTQEFDDNTESYANDQYFSEKVKTTAEALKVSGITKISRWEAVHPLVNKKVVGVVLSWSPGSAATAMDMGQKMSKKPQKKSYSGASAKQESYQSGSNQGGNYRAAGATADEDSF